ncbi:MAG: hypothetical protein M3167_06135 [Acidobacteriota bacterium]|nr:hypothetical protein [Acidobacteriota bacterium]MDQ6892243.1 hypothetical protein [Acidobacteriota bacterium]
MMKSKKRPRAVPPPPKCPTGKWVYVAEAEAAFFGKTLQQRPYRCEVCGRFHLTTQPKGERV